MKYETIIFDLDGTLLDTLDDITDSVNLMLEGEGYPLRTKEEIRQFVGNGAKNLVRKALPDGSSEAEIERCLSVYRPLYLDNMFQKTGPYEGVPETLKRLKALGVKIGVVSNKPDDATEEMCRIYFGSDLDAVIGDNPARRKKPAPDNIFEIMRRLGSERKKTLYVGDSDVDMATAGNSGLDCVGVTWGYRPKEMLIELGAGWIVERPEQLIELIEREELQTGGIRA